MLLKDRYVALSAGSKKWENLRVAFSVEKALNDGNGIPSNKAGITIYNLNADSRAMIEKQGTPILLDAGYKDSHALIYSGEARFVNHQHLGPDWITKIECSTAITPLSQWVSVSLAPGSDLKLALQDVIAVFGGSGIGAMATVMTFPPRITVKGISVSGPARDVLAQLLANFNHTASFDDNQLILRAKTKGDGPASFALESIVILTSMKGANTGLIGSIEKTEQETDQASGIITKAGGIKGRSYLQAAIRPGSSIIIGSKTVNGKFRVTKVTHHGDSMQGDEFFSDFEAQP